MCQNEMFHLGECESENKDNLLKLYFFIYSVNSYRTIHMNRKVSANNKNSSDFHQRINSCIEGYVDYHSWNLLPFIVVYIFCIESNLPVAVQNDLRGWHRSHPAACDAGWTRSLPPRGWTHVPHLTGYKLSPATSPLCRRFWEGGS